MRSVPGNAGATMRISRRMRSEGRAARHGTQVCALLLLATAGCGQTPAAPAGGAPSETAAVVRQPSTKGPSTKEQHPAKQAENRPLEKALALAQSSLDSLTKIKDYACVFVKRERVGGELLDEERLEMKVRHKPFSVYMRFIAPESATGKEAIYVEGRNDGKLIGHTTGLKGQVVGSLPLDPTGYLAMMDNRYPITNAGMKNLVTLLLKLGQRKDLLKNCRVSFVEDQKVDDRPCLLIEIKNPRTPGDFKLAKARIWLDHEWNAPVRFESWEWPAEAGAEPVLVEQYSYLKLKFNQGLTDFDFDPTNPKYEFP
jgi:hypothetical protein